MGAKDIMNEFALEYVDRVNKMAEGRLRIDYLTAGAVVKPFEITDAVSKGVLDAGHQVPCIGTENQKLHRCLDQDPSTVPIQNKCWLIKRGGGYELYEKLLKKLNLDIKGFFAFPMPTQPLGWFKKKPPRGKEELKGFKYRTVGLAADLMQELGMKVTQLPGGEIIPAMERGVLDAFEFNNPTSDRRLGAQDVCKNYALVLFIRLWNFLRFFLTEPNLMH